MVELGKFFVGMMFIVIAIMISGFVLMRIWGWFIVPVFPLEYLLYGQAVGLAMFISLAMKSTTPTSKSTDFGDIMMEFFISILYTGFVFGFAWITHLIIA